MGQMTGMDTATATGTTHLRSVRAPQTISTTATPIRSQSGGIRYS